MAAFGGQTGHSWPYGQKPRSNLLWDPGFAWIPRQRGNPAEPALRAGSGPRWPITGTHRALSQERGVHGLTEVPKACKYSMLFDGIGVSCFGRKASMKPRGSRGRSRFHPPLLWPQRGHNRHYGQNPRSIPLWDLGSCALRRPGGRRNGASAPLRDLRGGLI